MVGVAQLVELRVVVPVAAGSSPVAHPTKCLQITVFLRSSPSSEIKSVHQSWTNLFSRLRPVTTLGPRLALRDRGEEALVLAVCGLEAQQQLFVENRGDLLERGEVRGMGAALET